MSDAASPTVTSGPTVTTGDVMMSLAKYVISFMSMLLTAYQMRIRRLYEVP
jgi:uncharacterized membrane protein